jgi:hypothetical protein
MKPGRLLAAITATLTAAVAATMLSLTGTADAATSRTVVFDCQHQPQERPASFILSCENDEEYFTGLSWATWTPALASATGVEQENDCVPSCAQGKHRSYRVLIVFWRGEPVTRHEGEKYFTRMTVLYPGARPSAADTWTGPLGS